MTAGLDEGIRDMIKRILFASLIVASMVLALFPVVAYADSETLRPDATGDLAQLTPDPGAANWQNVDEESSDSDSTYVHNATGSTTLYDLYNLPNGSGIGTISNVKVYVRARRSASGSLGYTMIKTNGVGYTGDTNLLGSSYANFSTTYSTNPQTGSAWQWSEINALQIGVKINNTLSSSRGRCTQVWCIVTTAGPPTVVTSATSSIEETTARLNGSVSSINDTSITERGFVWDTSTHGDPGDVAPGASGYANNWTQAGTYGATSFYRDASSLTEGELYYARACAKNNTGSWAYGNEVTFLTKPDEPSNLVATGVAYNQIDLTWSKGTGAQNTYIRNKEGEYPTSKTDGNLIYDNTGTSYSNTGLSPSVTYYYRAWSYATEGGLEQYSDTYAENFGTTTDLPLRVWYQPETMIVGDVLPDREAPAQNGTISWGTNPGDVDTVIGSLLPSILPEPGTMGTAKSQDVLPEITQPGWFNTSNLEDNPLYPLIAFASTYTGFTIWQLWVILATLGVLIVAGLSFGYLKHMLVAAFLTTACAALFVTLGIYPWWVLIIFGFVDIALVVYERKSVI